MSDHDPLCRRAQITEGFMEGCPECAFIAKVREDQSCKCKFWNGYAAALDAARGAVAAVEMGGEHFWSVGFRDGITIALAAIDALLKEKP